MESSSTPSSSPLRDAIARIDALPDDSLELAVTKAEGEDLTVSLDGDKTVGKGWSVGGFAALAKQWAFGGRVRWTKK